MIVLMTDFGESEYVGMMKGVIHSIHPDVVVTDLTHQIPPQSIREGAWVLLTSYRYFPKKSTFVAVVDPGVGTERDAILVITNDYAFIGPDNGLLYPAAHADGLKEVLTIEMGTPESTTFHGRDVFARFAAYHAKGSASDYLSSPRSDMSVKLEFYLEGRTGEVVRHDRFGNLITNLPPLKKTRYTLVHGSVTRKLDWYKTYGVGPTDDVFLVTSSAKTLELCMRDGSAADILDIRVGDRITIE